MFFSFGAAQKWAAFFLLYYRGIILEFGDQ